MVESVSDTSSLDLSTMYLTTTRDEAIASGNPLVFVFGQNSYGELGLSDTTERHLPTQVHFFDDLGVCAIAAGNEHIACLTKQGEVYTVGFNGSGQLGHGNIKSISMPKRVESLRGHRMFSLASANGCENLAITSEEGRLYTSGYNNYGQLGHGTQSNLSTPTLVSSIKDRQVVNVSCSYYHSIIVTTDTQQTQVYSVGRNDNGQLGQDHTNHELIPRVIRSLSQRQVVSTACGLHHSVFVTAVGEVFSCGFNDNGQLGHNETRSVNSPTLIDSLKNKKIVQVACGYYHTIVRKDTGEIYAFGRNDKGQLGIETSNQAALTTPKQITNFLSVELPLSMMASAKEGIVDEKILLENVQYVAKRVSITKIACGCYHSIALCENGNVYTFGRGNHGQLGHGNTDDQKTPKMVANLYDKKVIEIAGGFYHTILLVKQKKLRGVSQLSSDMKKIINDSQRADVTFIIDSKQVHAHRCVLLARCRTLSEKARIEGRKSSEQEQTRIGTHVKGHVFVDLGNLSYKGFLALLEFVYTDQIADLKKVQPPQDQFDVDLVLDVLQLSHIFKVDRLRRLCEDSVEPGITIENCAKIMKKAVEIGNDAEQLKKVCLNYILQNYQQVIGISGYYDLPIEILKEIGLIVAQHGVKVTLNQQPDDMPSPNSSSSV